MDILGVVTWPREAQGAGWLGGPFEPDGPWPMFADARLGFTVLAFTSFSVVWTLSDRLQLRETRAASFFLRNNGFADVTTATVEPVAGETPWSRG